MADPVFVDEVTPLDAANMNKLQTRDEKAAANGYPSLGADGKVPLAQLPAIGGGADLSYDGDWAAGTYQDGDVVVKDGVAYLCVGGPTTTAPDPGPWGYARVPVVGDELAYAENTAGATISATSDATANELVAAPAVTVDGTTQILIEFSSPFCTPANAVGAFLCFVLYQDGVAIGRMGLASNPNGGTLYEPLRLARRLTPTAGAHTYSIRGFAAGGNGSVTGGVGGGTAYFPMFVRVSRVLPVPPTVYGGTPTGVTYGTSLPASPADGQEAILVDSVTAPTYQWRFRYNAGNASAYKWEFVGGAPADSLFNAQETIPSTSYADLATVSPTFTAPRAGVYDLQWTWFAHSSGSGGWIWATPKIGAAATVDDDGSVAHLSAAGETYSVTRQKRFTLAASDLVKFQYKRENGASASRRSLAVLPVRVA